MSRQNKNYMPQSGAGLMRFNEDDRSGIKLRPEHVVIMASVVGVGLILVRLLV